MWSIRFREHWEIDWRGFAMRTNGCSTNRLSRHDSVTQSSKSDIEGGVDTGGGGKCHFPQSRGAI
jgi:hypothetical protein